MTESNTPKRTRHSEEAPQRERRGSHRVGDDQQSGQGSLTALSKLKMIERKRAELKPVQDDAPPRKEPGAS